MNSPTATTPAPSIEDVDPRARDVVHFWFDTLTPKQWFMGGEQVDRMIAESFGDLITAALHSELWQWRNSAKGRLAEILILDQFTRNCFRGSAKAFSGDAMALVLAQEAIAQNMHQALTKSQCQFLYMPLMHSESSKPTHGLR